MSFKKIKTRNKVTLWRYTTDLKMKIKERRKTFPKFTTEVDKEKKEEYGKKYQEL